jgi:hypothetical protein
MPSSSAQGSPCDPSSNGSPRFKTPSPISPTLLLLSRFDRALEMRRYLRSYIHTMRKTSLSSSAWWTNTPGLWRDALVIHSLLQKQGRPASLTQMLLLMAAAKKRKKKKAGGKDKPLASAPTVAAVAAGGGRGPHSDNCPQQPSTSNEGRQWCPVHNSKHHSHRGVSGDQEAYRAVP